MTRLDRDVALVSISAISDEDPPVAAMGHIIRIPERQVSQVIKHCATEFACIAEGISEARKEEFMPSPPLKKVRSLTSELASPSR